MFIIRKKNINSYWKYLYKLEFRFGKQNPLYNSQKVRNLMNLIQFFILIAFSEFYNFSFEQIKIYRKYLKGEMIIILTVFAKKLSR
jgi:hypothetical protein